MYLVEHIDIFKAFLEAFDKKSGPRGAKGDPEEAQREAQEARAGSRGRLGAHSITFL